jgi:RimJ/RimL family protein N-acetyltransferase
MTDAPLHPPDWQPTLCNDALLLRPTRAADWWEMYSAASDPLIWTLHPVRERYREPLFRENFDEGLASGGMLTIVERGSGAIIGSSRYHGNDPVRGEVEIGWTFLVRRHWGGETNAAVKRLMLDHAFGWVDCVYSRVGATNWRSRRAMEKIGGRLREGLVMVDVRGTPQPYVVFEIRKPAAA